MQYYKWDSLAKTESSVYLLTFIVVLNLHDLLLLISKDILKDTEVQKHWTPLVFIVWSYEFGMT